MSTVLKLPSRQKAKPVGIVIPKNRDPELYKAGYEHGLTSNSLKIFKSSFCEGFRDAKLHLRETQPFSKFACSGDFKIRFTCV